MNSYDLLKITVNLVKKYLQEGWSREDIMHFLAGPDGSFKESFMRMVFEFIDAGHIF